MSIQTHTLESIQEHIFVGQGLLGLTDKIWAAGVIVSKHLEAGNKILICGNGGSAADAIHFAAELTGQFENKQRKPLPAIALSENISAVTAIANDFNYASVFERQVMALGNHGDVLIAISTSGKSENIRLAAMQAKVQGMTVILLTGNMLGSLASLCDIVISVPSTRTARIQEAHMLILHCIAEIVDAEFTGK